jgi:hypothetical protein
MALKSLSPSLGVLFILSQPEETKHPLEFVRRAEWQEITPVSSSKIYGTLLPLALNWI